MRWSVIRSEGAQSRVGDKAAGSSTLQGRRATWKSAGAAGLVGVVATAAVFLLAPAGAHVNKDFGHVYNDHIKPKVDRSVVSDSGGDPNSSPMRIAAVDCPKGLKPVGGGARIGGNQSTSLAPAEVALKESLPTKKGWFALAQEVVDTNKNWRLTAYAICVRL